MNLLQADSKLLQIGVSCLTTREVAAYLNVTTVYASNILCRLVRERRVTRLGRGRWLIGNKVDPFAVPEYLTTPYQTYISLQSALYHHGMISQIPAVVYAVSLARTKRYRNLIGEFSIHHVKPGFFFGYETLGRSTIKMALPEKALVDYIYLSLGRSKLFGALPELELPRTFSLERAHKFIDRIPNQSKRRAVLSRVNSLVDGSRK